MSRFICHRRVLGKRLYVNRVGGGTRDWGYDQRPAHAKALTAAQAALFKSDMDYMSAPSSCGVVDGNLSGRGARTMARYSKRKRGLQGGAHPGDLPDRCATDKKLTLCVGDRVERTIKLPAKEKQRLVANGFWRGEVVSLVLGQDNKGRAKMAARVRFDGDRPGDGAMKWLFEELKKV